MMKKKQRQSHQDHAGIVPCGQAYHDGSGVRRMNICCYEASSGLPHVAAIQGLLLRLKDHDQALLWLSHPFDVSCDYRDICGPLQLEPYLAQALDVQHCWEFPAIYPRHCPAVDDQDVGKM